MELTEKQKLFIEFLIDPEKSISENQWCVENDVPVRTKTSWKKHRLFREEWEKRSYEVYGGPEKVNAIVEAVYQSATKGDMKAAQLYLQYVDKFTPKKEIVTEAKSLKDMTDEELAELGENVIALRQAK